MKYIQILITLSFALSGCASSQDKAYEAQEGVHNERLKLIEDYQKCMKEAGEDSVKIEMCDQYLKAAEALK